VPEFHKISDGCVKHEPNFRIFMNYNRLGVMPSQSKIALTE